MSQIRVDMVPSGGDKTANAVGGIDSKLKELGRSAQAVAKETERGANLTAGSYAKLRAELKKNQRELELLEVGTREFDEQKKKVDELSTSVKNAQQQIKGGGGFAAKVGASVKDFATSVVGFATLTGGVIAAANLLKSELDDLKRRDNESEVAVKTREQSIAGLVQNAGGDLADKIVDRAEATQGVTGADADKLLAIASSVSSAGITDPAEIVDIAQTALRSQGGDAGRGAAVAGAAIDLSNTLEISVKEAFGVLFQTAGAARPEDIALLGKAAVKATAALRSVGVASEQAQELFAATTLQTGDKTGEQAVSVANDLANALQRLRKEGLPDEIEIGGEKVAIQVGDHLRKVLSSENVTLPQVLQVARNNAEVEKAFESLLPRSQNIAFTQQIVGSQAAFEEKRVQAAQSINLATAGARTDQQIADVEGRRIVGVLAEQVDAVLDRNLQDQGAALQALARDTFEAIQQRTDIKGIDAIQERAQNAGLLAREGLGESAAEARANTLRNLVANDSFVGKDRETAEAGVAILEQIQSLADRADAGGLSSREANAELAQLREVLQGILANNERQREIGERQVQLLEAAAGNQPRVQQVKNVDAGPVEAPPAAGQVP